METKNISAIIYDASLGKTIFEGEPIENAYSLDDDTNEVVETTEQTTENAEVAENEESENSNDPLTTQSTDTDKEEGNEVAETEETSEEEEEEEECKNPYAQAILAEMNRRVEQGDERLAEALQSKDKSIKECCEYMEFRAKKWAEEHKLKGNTCVWMSDADGYALAHHYYIESKETIDAEMPKPQVYNKPKELTEEQKKAEETKKKIYTNPLLASLLKKGATIENAEGGEIAVTKTTTKKDENGNVVSSKSIKTDAEGTRTTTIKKDGKEYTMTEFSLF